MAGRGGDGFDFDFGQGEKKKKWSQNKREIWSWQMTDGGERTGGAGERA